MSEGNGAHVTWRELNLALRPIKEGITRIEKRLDDNDQGKWLGPQGRLFVQGAGIVSALAALLIALFK